MYSYLEDVESDMSAFHRIDDVGGMAAQLFIDRATRLSAYKGVIRARIESEQNENSSSSTPARGGRDGLDRTVDSDGATLASDPGLGGVFEVKTGPADAGQGIQAT